MSSKLIDVELTFTRSIEGREEDVTISAHLSGEDGWNQWGAPRKILGENVDAVQAVHDALSEHWG